MGWQNEIPKERHNVPEHAMLAKMLRQAVLDYLQSSAVRPEDYESAEIWLFNDVDDQPLSFHQVCMALELDKGNLRNLITQMKMAKKLPKGW